MIDSKVQLQNINWKEIENKMFQIQLIISGNSLLIINTNNLDIEYLLLREIQTFYNELNLIFEFNKSFPKHLFKSLGIYDFKTCFEFLNHLVSLKDYKIDSEEQGSCEGYLPDLFFYLQTIIYEKQNEVV